VRAKEQAMNEKYNRSKPSYQRLEKLFDIWPPVNSMSLFLYDKNIDGEIADMLESQFWRKISNLDRSPKPAKPNTR
jgi:hypothetical protein